jgi:DNA-binding transcriptional LysR family regulator
MLDDGAYDFSVAVHEEPASWHIRQPLFSQCSVCVYDPTQLMRKAPLTLEDFVDAAHVTVSFEGNTATNLDIVLAKAGLRRQVVATVPRFSALPPALRAMPAIATIPESIARCIAQLHGLEISEPPIELPADPVTMLYRRVDRADGRSVWFRRLFVDIVEGALKASGCSMTVSKAA